MEQSKHLIGNDYDGYVESIDETLINQYGNSNSAFSDASSLLQSITIFGAVSFAGYVIYNYTKKKQ